VNDSNKSSLRYTENADTIDSHNSNATQLLWNYVDHSITLLMYSVEEDWEKSGSLLLLCIS
jgi:hypothetical protein